MKRFLRAALCIAVIAAVGSAAPPPAVAGSEPVVLLHGLGRTYRSMRPLERYLEDKGFTVLNIGYPSTSHGVEQLADMVHDRLRTLGVGKKGRAHFVTHSLGGILLRWLHGEGRFSAVGRVVMLSPPNGGSEVADRLKRFRMLRKLLGPAIGQLGTDRRALPSRLGKVDFTLGVITGNRSLNPLFSHWLPGPDDGKVAVERARVAGMSDFLVLPHSHAFIMKRPEVMRQVVHFLRNGRFDRRRGGE